MQEIKTISLGSRIGGVNCYLVRTHDGSAADGSAADGGYVLIDTGMGMHRAALDKALQAAGCQPGKLALVVLTHGDADHAGNAAFLRDKYGARIMMHRLESPAAERGSMLLSRKHPTRFARLLFPLFRLSKADRFKPDIYVDDGDDLSEYGLAGRVLHLPGHSIGSIGVVTTGGLDASPQGAALFCGDLMTNTSKPEKNTLVDDTAEMDASIARLKGLGIKIVYPGHGKPFALEELVKGKVPISH